MGRMPPSDSSLEELSSTLSAMKSTGEVGNFLVDLCTPAELRSLAERWRVAKLVDGGLPYREINERTGVSTATITRVARAIQQGMGGYRRALDKKQRHSTKTLKRTTARKEIR